MRPHTDIFKPTDLRQLHTGRSTAVRFHGLRGALAIAGRARNPTRARLPPAPAISMELSVADEVIAEAASQVRRLLRASSASMIGVRENRENQYV